MRVNGPELFVIALILTAALVNVLLYFGPIVREDGVYAADTPRIRAARAERDDSESLPGRFVATQGRRHTPEWPLAPDERVPFCEPDAVEDTCYASNPPTSGLHLPVARTVVIDGETLNLPPDPGVYRVEIPREAIPHLQEHAGVFVGYHCASTACDDAVVRLRLVVQQELSLGARVVMSPDTDLDDDTIGLASWTRVDVMRAGDYDDARARDFIKAHSCRFDPENFCGNRPLARAEGLSSTDLALHGFTWPG
jgi:hypothetical protein